MLDANSLDAGNAIVAAVAVGGQAVATDAINASVRGLVDQVAGRFDGDGDALADLRRYVRRPSAALAWDVREHLARHGVDQDGQLVADARTVLEQAWPTVIGHRPLTCEAGAPPVTSTVPGTQVEGGGAHTVRSAPRRPAAPAQPGLAPWRVLHYTGPTYLLQNTCPGPVFDVHLDVPGASRLRPAAGNPPVWKAGEGRTFYAATPGPTHDLIVRYTDHDGGPTQEWRETLPPPT